MKLSKIGMKIVQKCKAATIFYNAPHKLDQKKMVNPSKKGKEWSVV